MNLLLFLDYAGIAVFAATGGLAASRKQLDIIGFLFLAGVTASAAARSAIWFSTSRSSGSPITTTCWSARVVAVAVFFGAHLVESRYRLLLWLDAVGLSAYCVFGAYKGLEVTGSPVVAVVTGVLTATFGGILRDILAGEASVLLRPEIYVTAALAGSVVYVLADLGGSPAGGAALIAFSMAFFVRGGALAYGWTFPPYRSRPGRAPEDTPRGDARRRF